uniref:FMRFamide n=1 Tax=Panagrellus redivivus TaxID=6233 RepID=A0A7E4VZP9_PANRE
MQVSTVLLATVVVAAVSALTDAGAALKTVDHELPAEKSAAVDHQDEIAAMEDMIRDYVNRMREKQQLAMLKEMRDKNIMSAVGPREFYEQEVAPSGDDADKPEFNSSPEKRAQSFVRFGKRGQSFVRFGKRAQDFVRFGKRAQSFVRFGKRAQDFDRFGKRAQDFVRFGKRGQSFVRFG